MFYTAHLTKGAALDLTNLLNQNYTWKRNRESASREIKNVNQRRAQQTHLVASGVRINLNLITVFLKPSNREWKPHVKSKLVKQTGDRERKGAEPRAPEHLNTTVRFAGLPQAPTVA